MDDYTAEEVEAECWLDVVGYEGSYKVSSFGRIRSFKSNPPRILSVQKNDQGYATTTLSSQGKSSKQLIHRIVARAFLGPRPEGMEVCHNDGNRMNCRLANLRYGTRSENVLDSVKHGTNYWSNKMECPKGHPYDEYNTRIYRGRRRCRTCEGWKGVSIAIRGRQNQS